MPRLVELYDRFESMGVEFVSIDAGERPAAAETFLDENNVRHVVLNDADRSVREAYNITGIPVTILIDHEGRVIYRHLGFSPGDEMKLAMEIETLLAWKGQEA